ncbi:atp synthase subunit alpha mitochondrial [Holotrichia oblita]|nr:atp synthase subunit alpha mitochondrial [Holotrichia oblita]
MEEIRNQIKDEIKKKINNYKRDFDLIPAGTVLYSGDGIVKISGLENVRYNELLEINGSVQAIALNLEENEVGAIVLGDESKVAAGHMVRALGAIVEVPVGEKLLGRVVNPLGVSIDGLDEIITDKRRPIEAPAPQITDRSKVNEPLQTGIIAIDSMIPIGKGQRELIIGDRQTGKSAIAIDTIINQKDKDVYCVYVAIGQKASTISQMIHTLNLYNAMEYTTVVCSTAQDSAPLQYIAPYAGCAIAEELMYSGKDVLVIYDDLSKHAAAYRAMSLLLKRPPGREAYPGDIFYLHSRLLERAAKLDKRLGGGSMTALPIVETQAGDISAYIPTNVISITDGQIYLESELFNSGVRPAINVGLSVSRVGSSAQIDAMKKLSGKLRLNLSQYRELAIFAQFGTDLDASAQKLLVQGGKITETLKQEQYIPYEMAHQVLLLYLIEKNHLDEIPVKRIRAFNKGFLHYFDSNYDEVTTAVRLTGKLKDDQKEIISRAVSEYTEYFLGHNE